MRKTCARPIWAAALGFLFFSALSASSASAETPAQTLERLGKSKPVGENPLEAGVGSSGRTEEDVRRQKEEAAESLNRTLREIDERTRTRAIDDGRAIIVP